LRSATSLLLASSLAALAAGILVPAAPGQPTIANWSKPGRDGHACLSCHSLSGREVWSTSIENLTRRARNHLSEEESLQTAESIAAIRGSAGSSTLRPFEPAGGSYAGTTATERDEAFGQSLGTLVPKLAAGQVWTLNDAEAAAQELCATPLPQVKTGLIFDPLSRDPVRAADGPLLGDWIPDVALSPEGTEVYQAACLATDDRFDADDLLRISAALNTAEGRPKSAIIEMSRLKRLALLKYTEQNQRLGELPAPVVAPQLMPDDPIWGVGNVARLYNGMSPQQLGMTEEMAKTAGLEWGVPIELNQMALSWFWVAWTLDPSLQHTSLELKAKTGQYMAQSFWDAGPYPWHAAYFAARRPMEERAGSGQALQPEINAFVNEDVLLRIHPANKASLQAFAHFCANVAKMDCLLMERDLKAGLPLANQFSARQQMNALVSFAEPHLTPEEARRTRDLVARCLKSLP
jgi:hypothetical protein